MDLQKTKIDVAVCSRNILGEGPIWDALSSAVLWVDIKRQEVHRYHPELNEHLVWAMPEPSSFVIPHQGGGVVVGHPSGVYHYDAAFQNAQLLCDPEPGQAHNRLNDGCCAPSGDLYLGTMDQGETRATGSFYRVQPDGHCQKLFGSMGITNGPAFNQLGTQVFYADTLLRTIYQSRVLADGSWSAPEVFKVFTVDEGYPDGMALDSIGRLWCCHWGGARLSCTNPSGELAFQVALPVSNPTKCAFGGADYRTVYITSARKGLTDQELQNQPLAGSLLALDVEIPGFRPGSFGAC